MALFAVLTAVAAGVMAGCSDSSASASADEEKAFKTRKAELPANFSTKPKDGVAFVGESKSIQIGGNAAPSTVPNAGAGGTAGGGAGGGGENK